MRRSIGGVDGTALLLGVLALCCGGPILLAALAATSLGAWLLAAGGSVLAAIAFLAAATLGVLWLRRRRWLGTHL